MMRKFFITLVFFIAMLLLSTPKVLAASCANSPFGVSFSSSPPENIASNLQTLPITLINVPSRMGDQTTQPIYEIYVVRPTDDGSTIEIKIAEQTLPSSNILNFTFTRLQNLDVFNLNPIENDKNSKKLVLKEKNSGNTCDLWSYRAYSTPVQPTGRACGDLATRNGCGPGWTGGGCQTGYECQSLDEGFRCIQNENKCGAIETLPPTGGTPPTTDPPTSQPPTGGGVNEPVIQSLKCGNTTKNADATCDCPNGGSRLKKLASDAAGYCCGWPHVDACYGTVDNYNKALAIAGGDTSVTNPPQGPVSGAPQNGGGSSDEGTTENTSGMDIFQGPKSADFKELNPLRGNPSLSSPGGILSRVLIFAFPLAGLILFTMLVWGGFEMLVGATGKGIDAGKQRVTNAVIGFFALFISYWVFQIVEVIFGLQIL